MIRLAVEGPGPPARRRPPGRFHRCETCDLILRDPAEHLDRAKERERYLLHRNTREDAGYVAFLEQLLDPACAFLAPGMKGLDYGCGPAPVLSRLMAERGWPCDAYDPFFQDASLRPPYDFLLAAEVFEHFRRPGEEIDRMRRLLRPGSVLGIMTERWTTPEAFRRWHYATDPTHVSFFHARTFEWMADHFGWRLLRGDEARVRIYEVL